MEWTSVALVARGHGRRQVDTDDAAARRLGPGRAASPRGPRRPGLACVSIPPCCRTPVRVSTSVCVNAARPELARSRASAQPRPASKRPHVCASGVAASSVSTWQRPRAVACWPHATKATLVRSMGAHQPHNDTGEFVRRGFFEFPKQCNRKDRVTVRNPRTKSLRSQPQVCASVNENSESDCE